MFNKTKVTIAFIILSQASLDSEHVACTEATTRLRPYLHANGVKTLVSVKKHCIIQASL
ncbi:MAG: hypothetical protein OCC45_08460 [Desulfotalea sp.]